jgi:hypothetical protein
MTARPATDGGAGHESAIERWAKRGRAEHWIALLAVLAFLPALRAGFVFDDTTLIVKNPYAHGLEHLLRPFTTHFWNAFRSEGLQAGLQYYRPLVSSSFVLDWVASGGKPWLFHLVNIAAHAAATFLAVRIAKRWIGHTGLAIVAGLVFALHPTRTENVIWIVGRTDVFMALFLFATIELVHTASQRQRGRAGYLLAAAFTAICALLSKEPSLLLGLLLAVDWFRAEEDRSARRVHGLAALGAAAIGVIYLVGRNLLFPVHPRSELVLTPQHGFMSIFSYVERSLLPWPQTFAHRLLEYSDGAFVYPLPLVIAGIALALAYFGLLAWFVRRDRAAAWLLLCAGAFLGPLLNFTLTNLPFTSCDRFLYLPLFLGTTALLRGFKARLVGFAATPAARAAVLVWCVLAIGVNTWRAGHYTDDLTLFRYELALNPNNVIAYDRLTAWHAERGDLQTALELALEGRKAGRVYPQFRTPYKLGEEYTMILSLLAARIADGDRVRLEALFGALDDFASRRRPRVLHPEVTGGETIDLALNEVAIGRVLDEEPRLRAQIASTAAFVATRLDRMTRAKQLLAALPDDELRRLPDPPNLLLAHARAGDFAGAERRAALLRPLAEAFGDDYRAALADAEARIARAREAFDRGENAREPLRSIAFAQSRVEVGAYRAGLRELEAIYAATPGAVAPLYVQLLVALRLESRAIAEAAKFLGAEKARAAVAQLRAELPASIRRLPPVDDDSGTSRSANPG